jgi:hypothetical protein
VLSTSVKQQADPMTSERLISERELNSRTVGGLQVRLLWSKDDGRVWVAVTDTRTGDCFRLDVLDAERPVDVFQHPYAYAALHGVSTGPERRVHSNAGRSAGERRRLLGRGL